MSTTNVNIRMDSEIKAAAEAMFADMGLNMSTAVNIFVRQALRQGKIPFEITSEIPNAETLEAMKEAEDILSGKKKAKVYTDLDELFRELDS